MYIGYCIEGGLIHALGQLTCAPTTTARAWVRPTTEFGQLHKRTTQLVCLLAAMGFLAGCQLPSAPEWEVGVLVQLDRIALGDYLPSGVIDTTVGGQAVFVAQRQETSMDFSLSRMCPACGALQGLKNPVPDFDFAGWLDVRWPDEVVSVGLASATLTFRIRNDMGFDPLRPHPNPDSAGFIALVGKDLATGALLDSVLLSGASDSLPPGTTRDIVLNVTNVEVAEGVRTLVNIHSPSDGQITTVDTALMVGFTTTVDDMLVAGVTAVIDSDTLNESFTLDIDQSVRAQVAANVSGGTVQVEMFHNIDVVGLLEVSMAGSAEDLFSGSPVNELQLLTLDFAPAPTGRLITRTVTSQELQFIASLQQIHIGYRGVASGASTDPLGRPTARLTPDMFVEARVRLTAALDSADVRQAAGGTDGR